MVMMALHTFLCKIALEAWNVLFVARGGIGMMLDMAKKMHRRRN